MLRRLIGFPVVFEEQLTSTSVGIPFAPEAAGPVEAALLLDLPIRLLARLYPKLDITLAEREGFE
ncbi:MAG: hypothetical protein ACREOS_11415, partial [Candidatus Dormibacteraceae bacterium]